MYNSKPQGSQYNFPINKLTTKKLVKLILYHSIFRHIHSPTVRYLLCKMNNSLNFVKNKYTFEKNYIDTCIISL